MREDEYAKVLSTDPFLAGRTEAAERMGICRRTRPNGVAYPQS